MQFVGFLLIVNSLAAGAWWIATGRPQLVVVPICAAVLAAGVFLMRQDAARSDAPASVEPTSAATLEELTRQTADAKTLLADLQDQTAAADWHLKQLDEHLRAVQVLPDGRTKFGDMVSGAPVVLTSKLETLQKQAVNFPADAYPLAKECVNILETTRERIQGATVIGAEHEANRLAWLYETAATLAQRAGEHDAALQWARAAVKERPSTERQFLLVTALINKNLNAEANDLIKQQLRFGGAEAAKFRQFLEQYTIPLPAEK